MGKSAKSLLLCLSFMAIGLILISCAAKKQPAILEDKFDDLDVGKIQSESGSYLEIGPERTSVTSLALVYFDRDKAELGPEARIALKKNSAFLKSALRNAPALQLRIEGHCDERGTLEYNMALGQRRADSVHDYYQSMGISKSNLSTVSYGEERPVCTGSNESCWSNNRRGSTLLRSKPKSARIPIG